MTNDGTEFSSSGRASAGRPFHHQVGLHLSKTTDNRVNPLDAGKRQDGTRRDEPPHLICLPMPSGRTFAASNIAEGPDLGQLYQEMLALIGRLHCQLLNVVRDELDRHDETAINSVQALILFNVGDQVLTPGSLRKRQFYFGSNVSYNLKKLIELGYIQRERSPTDARSVLVRLTRTGANIRKILCVLFDRHTESLEAVANLGARDLKGQNARLRNVARHVDDQIGYRR